MTSKTTMRREIQKAGGYYNREMGRWVIPGRSHNCAPHSTQTQWFGSLEEAYEAAPKAADANREVQDFGEREHEYLARARW